MSRDVSRDVISYVSSTFLRNSLNSSADRRPSLLWSNRLTKCRARCSGNLSSVWRMPTAASKLMNSSPLRPQTARRAVLVQYNRKSYFLTVLRYSRLYVLLASYKRRLLAGSRQTERRTHYHVGWQISGTIFILLWLLKRLTKHWSK